MISGKAVPDTVDHGQGRDAAGLADGHQGAGRAVDRNGIGLHLIAIVNMRDVRTKTVRPSICLIGNPLIVAMTSGLLFIDSE